MDFVCTHTGTPHPALDCAIRSKPTPSSRLAAGLALALAGTGLLAGCEYECTGKDLPEVASLYMRADVGCPTVAEAQGLLSELGHKVVSLADSKVGHPILQICWYRIQAPLPTHKCVDHDFTPDEPVDDILDTLSRAYYHSLAMERGGTPSWGWQFNYPSIVSCDAAGGLYGDIQALSVRAQCPVEPPLVADNRNYPAKLVLSNLVGADVVPEQLTCDYNITYRQMCSALGSYTGNPF